MQTFHNKTLQETIIANKQSNNNNVFFALIGYDYELGRIDMEDRMGEHIKTFLYPTKEGYDFDVEALKKNRFSTIS